MKFTVYGASGFIGASLIRYLKSMGHEVDTVSRQNLHERRNDLGHCVYAIGLTSDFRTRPFDTIEAHVSLLNQILRDAKFQSFLYLSSTRVYAKSGRGDEDACLPVSSTDPSDLYNISKLAGEAICLSSGLDAVRVARLSNVIGLHEVEADTFVGDLCREARRGHIQLKTDPASSKDYVWIQDVVEVLTRIAVEGRHAVYNVASGVNLPHQAWLDAISAISGCTVAVDEEAPRVTFPLISVKRIVGEFGTKPSSVLEHLPAILNRQVNTDK